MTAKTYRYSVVHSIPLILGFSFMLVSNFLANALPLNGQNTGQISDNYPNYFVPAGITFSIWGIIYLSLITLLFFYIRSASKRKIFEKKIYLPLSINFMLNGLWIFAWHYNIIILSIAIMLGLIYTLAVLFIHTQASSWYLRIPISIYFGWISVALIANITAFLVSISWEGFGIEGPLWSSILILVVALLTVYMIIRFQAYVFSMVAVWALFGIFLKQSIGDELLWPGNVSVFSIAMIASIAIFMVIRNWAKKSKIA